MGIPEKRTPQLPVTHNSDAWFADQHSKSLLKMLIAHIYLFVWHWSLFK